MTFDLTIKVTASDVIDTSIGVGRVGLAVAQQVSTAPVKVNQVNTSMVLGIPLTIRDLVLLRFAISIDASDYTVERAVISFDVNTSRRCVPLWPPTMGQSAFRAASAPPARISPRSSKGCERGQPTMFRA